MQALDDGFQSGWPTSGRGRERGRGRFVSSSLIEGTSDNVYVSCVPDIMVGGPALSVGSSRILGTIGYGVNSRIACVVSSKKLVHDTWHHRRGVYSEDCLGYVRKYEDSGYA